MSTLTRLPPDIALDDIPAALPLRQREVFDVLRDAMDGNYLTAGEIAKRSGTVHNKTQAIYTLGSKLLPTRWRIDIKRAGNAETFRLMGRS